jgi:hypothetical protein
MNYKEFSAKIKTKYPQYSDMDDADLANKMIAKYPQYSDVTFDDIGQQNNTSINTQQVTGTIPLPQPKTSEPSAMPKTLFGLDPFTEKDIFPTASQVKPEGVWNSTKRAGLGALDLLGAPTRAIGSLRGLDMSNPQSALLRPEMDALSAKIDKIPDQKRNNISETYVDPNLGEFAPFDPSGTKKLLKGAVEIGGNILSDPTIIGGAVKKAISKGAGLLNKLAGKVSQELSGVTEESLRMYGTGLGNDAKAIRAASGTQMKIANDMLDAIDDFDNYIPEKTIIDESLKNMPPIKTDNLIATLDNSINDMPITEGAQAANAKIEKLKEGIEKIFPDGVIPADKYRRLRIQFDNEIKAAFDKDYKDYIETAITKARTTMKDDLINAAVGTGNQDYVSAMKSYSDKLDVVDRLKGYVGKNSETRSRRVESFISNLFGKNSENKQQVVKELGELFGQDFLEESKLARIASDLGDGGVPSLMPRQTTGRSTLGGVAGAGQIGTGIATGNPALVASGASTLALSSPRASAAILETMDRVGQFGSAADKLVSKVPIQTTGLPAFGATVSKLMQEDDKEKNNSQKQAVFNSESEARQAGYGAGDRVRIRGVGLVELD